MAQNYILGTNAQNNISEGDNYAGALFNTLAQLGTASTNGGDHAPNDIPTLAPITRKEDIRTLEKRAQSKYFTHAVGLGLLKACRGSGSCANGYRRTLQCSSEIHVMPDGRAVSNYCKNRWCIVCNRIRTAITIKNYSPILETWTDAYFVTLTVRNVTGNELGRTVSEMIATFQKIAGTLKKRAQRGKGAKFVGVRKFECTANAKRDDYHPHFHVIVRGEANAHALRRAWLNANLHARSVAQDVRKADVQGSIELFKYVSKLVVKIEGGSARGVYADMQNVIFESIRGIRTLQSFGFKLPTIHEGEVQAQGDSQINAGARGGLFLYDHSCANWGEIETGELLLQKWQLPNGIQALAENIIVRPNYRRNGNRAFATKYP